MTIATPILFVTPPPPGIVAAAQQEARDLFSSLECWLSSAPALTLPLHLVEQQQQIVRPPGAATALAGPRSATRHWRRRSGSEGAPSISLLSIHPPPPPTPHSEYNLWPHPYRPDWL